ncbi:unnamed protein product [Acanthoscelides obtectus]|uniref:Uncharacterized protein n=1 Tax=Acanthoscelides obtectus TaxID=200917 RepID=A0A9P0M9Q7_ACAOB|nr:unnamed protein product [Acanthoscelides obtectus]CAK1632407.1 hypothetical protein AOBTE_LOCUS7545 [Acanthoscelides obtectus]
MGDDTVHVVTCIPAVYSLIHYHHKWEILLGAKIWQEYVKDANRRYCHDFPGKKNIGLSQSGT